MAGNGSRFEEGDGGNHLITYHPRGNSSSSKSLHNEPWLDFNMYQSGHDERFNNVYEFAASDRAFMPHKPTVEGEPAYEDIAVKFWEYMDFSKNSADRVSNGVLDTDGLIKDQSQFKEGFFTDYDVRVHAYWNFLSGACGYTYGNNAIWQMFKKGGNIAIPCLYDWYESMDRPGAFQLQYVRKLLEDKFHKIIPDQSLISGNNSKGENYIISAISTDNSFALVYLAKGQPVIVKMDKLKEDVTASWFNPRNGFKKKIGIFRNEGLKEFIPTTSGKDRDWMLVLEKL